MNTSCWHYSAGSLFRRELKENCLTKNDCKRVILEQNEITGKKKGEKNIFGKVCRRVAHESWTVSADLMNGGVMWMELQWPSLPERPFDSLTTLPDRWLSVYMCLAVYQLLQFSLSLSLSSTLFFPFHSMILVLNEKGKEWETRKKTKIGKKRSPKKGTGEFRMQKVRQEHVIDCIWKTAPPQSAYLSVHTAAVLTIILIEPTD